MAEGHFALRFTQRFACVGPACPATCCSGWNIPIDEPHYRSLKRAMSGTSEERLRFSETHVVAEKPVPTRYASLKILPNGDCSLLDADKLCSTHKRYGETQLSDTCSSYPRKLNAIGKRLELSAALSCPEAARLLLAQNDAADLDALDPGKLPRHPLEHVLDAQRAPPYARYLDDVRSTVMTLLAQPVPLAARLFLVARFCDRTRVLLHRDIAAVDEAALAAEMNAATNPMQVAQLALAYAGVAPSGPRAGFIITSALKERLDDPAGSDKLRALVRDALASYGANHGNAVGDELTIDPAAMMPVYFARREAWATQHARIDEMLTNYCKHYWMTSWYTDSPDLLVHAQKLHLRVAMLRFLLFSHPALGEPGAKDARATVERVATEIVYTFARAIEHQKDFVDRLEALLIRLELCSLGHAMFLLAI